MTEQCRSAGVLLHVTSLPSRYGCGSFGEEAKRFIDYLKKAGFRYWEILPYNIPDEFASPYSAQSSFFGNPLCIDLETLKNERLISESDLKKEVVNSKGNKYDLIKLQSKRLKFLRSVWNKIEDSSNETAEILKDKIKQYLSANANEEKSCKFFALKQLNKNTDWQNWTVTEDQAEADPKWKTKYESSFRFYAFLSYEFDKQWNELKTYANKNFVKIIGDVPIYVNLQSADVYYNRECFRLGENGYPTYVSGIPKCEEDKKGQKWGHPLYNVDFLRKDDFNFIANRFKNARKRFDIIRIDHFKAFSAYGVIAANETPNGKGEIKGSWADGLGKDCLQKITDEVGEEHLIAEDVGAENDDKIQDWLREFRIPGMKIIQTDSDIDGYGDSIAYTGTHDNNTLIGYLNSVDDKICKDIAKKNGKLYINKESLATSLIEKLFASRARIVIIPAQDLLLQDSSARMNTPGTMEKSNWMYALTYENMARLDDGAEKISNMLATNTHNKIKILKNDNVSIRDFFGEIIITYHKDDEQKCADLLAMLDAQGCRYYKNEINESIITNSEYEDNLDKRLERCSRMILVLSEKLFENAAVTRLIWYQIGYVLPYGNRLLTFYLEKIGNYDLAKSPIGTLNLQEIVISDENKAKNDYIKKVMENLVSSTVREKYFDDSSTNDYAAQKIHYKHVSLQLEIDLQSFQQTGNDYYYKNPFEFLEKIDVSCYLLAFSLDDVNVINCNYSDELKPDRHTNYLTNNGIISKKYRQNNSENKHCFVFDFLVPVHHPLGSIVKPYFVWQDKGSFDRFKNLIYSALYPYEILQRDIFVDETTKHIYFSFDFPQHEKSKELDKVKREDYKIGKIADVFYPQ